MPELPEVETLKKGLQQYILGKKIQEVLVHDRKVFEGDETQALHATVTNVRRFAKGLVIDLSSHYSFAIHIKLTGQLIYRDQETKDLPVEKPTVSPVPNKFTRVTIAFDDTTYLYFQEVRGFAWMKLLPTHDVPHLSFFKSLGPEPLPSEGSNTPKLTEDMFEALVSKSNLPIKVLLMEQKKIGGIGNIYANDACFDAHIDPRRKASSLSKKERETLYASIFTVLEKGMKYRGSSELNFVDILGHTGEYQHHALVYGKKGKPCIRNDGGTIQKLYLGGRGTFFCEICQS